MSDITTLDELNKHWQYILPVIFVEYWKPGAELDIAVRAGVYHETYELLVYLSIGQEIIQDSQIVCNHHVLNPSLSRDMHVLNACREAHEELLQRQQEIQDEIRREDG